MKNFITIILIISFSLSIIACAQNENSSEGINWYKEKYFEFDKSDYVTIESIENIIAMSQKGIKLEGDTKIHTNDFFIVKYDNYGKKLWSEKLLQNSEDSGISIVSDSLDNIYSASYSRVERDIHSNFDVHEMFLSKYNSFGIKQWTKKLGESFANHGMGLVVDLSDNVYVTILSSSFFENEFNFSDEENYLIKLNSFGKKQWAKKLGSMSSELFVDVWVDTSNHIHVTGITKSNFDENLNDQNNNKILVSYNSDGVLQ